MESIKKASLVMQCTLILVLISIMAPQALAETGKETTVHSNGKDHRADFAYTSRKTLPQNVFLDNVQQCKRYNERCLANCCSGCECLRFVFKCVGKC